MSDNDDENENKDIMEEMINESERIKDTIEKAKKQIVGKVVDCFNTIFKLEEKIFIEMEKNERFLQWEIYKSLKSHLNVSLEDKYDFKQKKGNDESNEKNKSIDFKGIYSDDEGNHYTFYIELKTSNSNIRNIMLDFNRLIDIKKIEKKDNTLVFLIYFSYIVLAEEDNKKQNIVEYLSNKNGLGPFEKYEEIDDENTESKILIYSFARDKNNYNIDNINHCGITVKKKPGRDTVEDESLLKNRKDQSEIEENDKDIMNLAERESLITTKKDLKKRKEDIEKLIDGDEDGDEDEDEDGDEDEDEDEDEDTIEEEDEKKIRRKN
jgi:hypothetical protein